jgi:hypothetical protein
VRWSSDSNKSSSSLNQSGGIGIPFTADISTVFYCHLRLMLFVEGLVLICSSDPGLGQETKAGLKQGIQTPLYIEVCELVNDMNHDVAVRP